MKINKAIHAKEIIEQASPETVNLLSRRPTMADVLKSRNTDSTINKLKNDIGDSVLGKLMTKNANVDSALEIKAMNAWYKLDRQYALSAIGESLNSNGDINETQLQKLLEARLVSNPKLRNKLQTYIQ